MIVIVRPIVEDHTRISLIILYLIVLLAILFAGALYDNKLFHNFFWPYENLYHLIPHHHNHHIISIIKSCSIIIKRSGVKFIIVFSITVMVMLIIINIIKLCDITMELSGIRLLIIIIIIIMAIVIIIKIIKSYGTTVKLSGITISIIIIIIGIITHIITVINMMKFRFADVAEFWLNVWFWLNFGSSTNDSISFFLQRIISAVCFFRSELFHALNTSVKIVFAFAAIGWTVSEYWIAISHMFTYICCGTFLLIVMTCVNFFKQRFCARIDKEWNLQRFFYLDYISRCSCLLQALSCNNNHHICILFLVASVCLFL